MYLLHQFLNQRVSNQNFHNHHLNIPDNIITKPEGNNMLRPIGYINGTKLLYIKTLLKEVSPPWYKNTTKSQLTICNHQQFIKNPLRELK
jgi:hypothetical protein